MTRENTYDSEDYVRREFFVMAAGMKFAAYRVRFPGSENFSPYQFHMTYETANSSPIILAMLGVNMMLHLEASLARFANYHDPIDEGKQIYYPDHGRDALIVAYKRRDGRIDFQIRRGGDILGLMDYEMAKLFCTLARQCLDGPRAGQPKEF